MLLGNIDFQEINSKKYNTFIRRSLIKLILIIIKCIYNKFQEVSMKLTLKIEIINIFKKI